MPEHFDYKVEPPPLCKPGYTLCAVCEREILERETHSIERIGDACEPCYVKARAETLALLLDAIGQNICSNAAAELEGFDGTLEELYQRVEVFLDNAVDALYRIQGKERWDRMFSEWANRKDKPCEKS
ncbi:MAG TPA: hypothetical protein VM238_18600 [Phycisphaerae bacterium]|nr:hypothetical protein [Phycisphaerae bacterium]